MRQSHDGPTHPWMSVDPSIQTPHKNFAGSSWLMNEFPWYLASFPYTSLLWFMSVCPPACKSVVDGWESRILGVSDHPRWRRCVRLDKEKIVRLLPYLMHAWYSVRDPVSASASYCAYFLSRVSPSPLHSTRLGRWWMQGIVRLS